MHRVIKTLCWTLPGYCKFLLFVCLCSVFAPLTAHANKFHLNQFGFLVYGTKVAIVPDVQMGEFWLIDADTKAEVLRGPLTQPARWEPSGTTVKVADFTAFNKPGRYFIRIAGVGESSAFTIGDNLYDKLINSLARSFYLHRAGIPLEKRFADRYQRPAGHPDLLVYLNNHVRRSGVDDGIVSIPKGWFDAGDYDKHTINTAFAVYFLMQAYQANEAFASKLDLNNPYSRNSMPDLLEEVVWGLDWLLAMQDQDGGVFQRVGGTQPGSGLPSQQDNARYVYAKNTSATLFLAAVSAHAARMFSDLNILPQYQTQLTSAAERAWQWASQHNRVVYAQPAGVNSQIFAWSNDDLKDDWSWAGAELANTTGKKEYFEAVQGFESPTTLQWQNVDSLAWVSLLENKNAPSKLKKEAKKALMAAADKWVSDYWASGYWVPLKNRDFVRESNYIAANRAFLMLKAHTFDYDRYEFRDGARALFDYLLGRNPLGISYVTGSVSYSPSNPRDWLSKYDAVKNPIPGMLVSGPSALANDPCEYASRAPAKRYVDSWCSEETNSVSLAGDAAMLYLAMMLRDEEEPQ